MSDYAHKTREELERLVMDNRNKLQILRFAMAGSKQKNVKEGKGLRKEIARLLTELRSSETQNILKTRSTAPQTKQNVETKNTNKKQ